MIVAKRTTIPPLLIRYWLGILTLTALSAAYTLTMTHLHHSQHAWGFQYLYGADFGWDLNIFRTRFTHFREPGFWQIPGYPLTYPALTGVVFGLLYKLTHPLWFCLSLYAIASATWLDWLVRRLLAEGISRGIAAAFAVTVLATCWPLWFVFDTGNIEGLVVIVLAFGMLAFVAQRWWLAAVLIAIAGATKIFPIVMLGLLLSRRRYKEFACGLAVAAALTLASLAILGPSIPEAQRNINEGFRVMTGGYALAVTPGALDTNHSLYTIVRYGVILAHHRHLYLPAVRGTQAEVEAQVRRDVAMLWPSYVGYVALTAVLGVLAYFLRIRKLPMLNQMLALTTCAVMLPPLSMDYTLLHLLIPFGLLCAYTVANRNARGLASCFVCFAFIFTAGTYFSVKYPLMCEFRALFLLALVIIVMRYPWPWPALDAEVAPR